ncbi:endonuclease/exonuclease/phosphatase family protein [Loktanella salsilacus]|nr:endonuclease/exonuclease/phosphatase family protein [Loktanella salsilacus]UTH45992.1 endonuclease/exonuclease/phosphatase family protein [Loktanella salsilacus]
MTDRLRLATYNIEWFNNLFNDAGDLLDDLHWSGRWGVTRRDQIAALGAVFTAMDADAIMVIEAPDTSRRRSTQHSLEGFAKRFDLRANRVLTGFLNDTQQEIALMYDPRKMDAAHAPLGSKDVPQFDGSFSVDLDHDGRPEPVRWSKPPLEVTLTPHGGQPISLIGVHAKSKAPHGADNPAHRLRINIENRRKQLAQCVWLRARVDQLLQQSQPVAVLGDFNDGPGLDEFETLFGRSSVEVVLGEVGTVPMFDPNARLALSGRLAAQPASARFEHDGVFLSVLLDYIMVSPDLAARAPRWTIWHPFDTPACYTNDALRDALLLASDHFPVTLDLPSPLASVGNGPT